MRACWPTKARVSCEYGFKLSITPKYVGYIAFHALMQQVKYTDISSK